MADIIAIGKNESTGAIVDNSTGRVTHLNVDELAVIKAALVRYRNKNELRLAIGEKRSKMPYREMAAKYTTKPLNRIPGAILGFYGLVCLGISETYARISGWK